MSTGIQVNLAALTGVLTDLRRDVDQGLTPSTHGVTGDLGDTAKFGSRSASGEVVAGATDVSYAASISSFNVGVHIENAHAIASMIEGAVAGYRIADALAGQDFPSAAIASSSSPAPPAGGLTPVFVGPLPAPKIPIQELTDSPHALNWDSYDTPRMWTMVKREVSEEAWRQMHAFRQISDALGDQHRRMLALRERLIAAWAPQGAGAEVLRVWDDHASALESDSMCAYMTAQAMNGILETLSDARRKLARLNDTWANVTTDYMPEWWDHKAELTNVQARVVMLEADRAIADYRKKIAVPNQAMPVHIDSGNAISSRQETNGPKSRSLRESSAVGSSANAGRPRQGTAISEGPSVPPPLPGKSPTQDGPGLVGTLAPVSLSPMNPPSVLPIPPGTTPYLPTGGAYALPGPWSPEGRMIPMPSASTSPPSQGVSGAPSMFGVPTGRGGSGLESPHRQRMATEQWEVAKGGPGIIGESLPWRIVEPEELADDIVDQFEKWIKVKGYPWELDPGEGAVR